MAQELTKTTLIHQIGKKYAPIAKGSDLSWTKEKSHFLAQVESNATLKACTLDSLMDAALQAGAMGLSWNPIAAHVYLIPRNKRRKRQDESWQDFNANVPKIAYASPSYRGLTYLAMATGKVSLVRAEVVYAADLFKYKGPMLPVEHQPTINPSERTHAKAIGVYAMALLNNGVTASEYIDSNEIAKIRQMSEKPDSIMWDPARLWTEGWKKSVIRRLLKTVPAYSPQLMQAQSVMNTYEGVTIDNDEQNTIKEEDELRLHALILDNLVDSPEVADKWLRKACFSVASVDSASALPASKLRDVEDLINTKIQEAK